MIATSLVVAACSTQQHDHAELFPVAAGGVEHIVPGDLAWTPTDIVVLTGDVVEVQAAGKVEVFGWSWFGRDGQREVGPDGTFDYPGEATYQKYPLAAGGAGPTPPFSLIGKIGSRGKPFPLGSHRVVTAEQAGRLYLGINDYHLDDNEGAFHVGIRTLEERPADSEPVDRRPWLAGVGAKPAPVEDGRLLMIFIDGLRYDALKEMVFAGHLPNFRRIFFEGGLDIGPTFTIAPSNTIPSTTASLTGSWPDRTGLFTQLLFDRGAGTISYLATPEGPVKAVEHIDQAWWTTPSRDNGRPPLLKRRIESAGHVFRSTVIPVMPDYPPDRYVQRIANEMPLFGAHLVKDYYFDRAETAYAIDDVIEHDSRVMFVYYAGVDSATHRSTRGLWGEARRDLVRIDQDLAKLERELEREGIAKKTYWLVYADHGSTGGKDLIPQSWDLANDFFYRSLEDADGDGVADANGGLGMNVVFQHDDITLTRLHSDLSKDHYAVCVSQAYDVAWVALPKQNFLSRAWSVTNDYFDLSSYQIDPDLEPVDLVRRLLEVRPAQGNLYPGKADNHPVALVLVRMTPDLLLVFHRESMAAIERRRVRHRRSFEYRYRVLESVEKKLEEIVLVDEHAPTRDPFGYYHEATIQSLLAHEPNWLGSWHRSHEWLSATAHAYYPDAVVAYAHMLLDDPDSRRVKTNARYDMFVVASPGWNFASAEHRAAPDHGGPGRDAKRIPFLVAGPGLARGIRIDRPSRIIDVAPTALGLAGISYDPATLDGSPANEIWADASMAAMGDGEALSIHWDHGLAVPLTNDEKVHGPLVHDSTAPLDLHNVAANLASLTSQEIVRLTDRSADVVIPGNQVRPIQRGLFELAHAYDRLPDNKLKRRPAELVDALRLHTITVGELTNPVQSLQHIDRAALTIDWLRNVLNDPFGKAWPEAFTPMTPVDLTLKQVSRGLLGTRRVLFEWLTRIGNSGIRRLEGVFRDSAANVNAHEWETPRTHYDEASLRAETTSRSAAWVCSPLKIRPPARTIRPQPARQVRRPRTCRR